MRRTDVDNHVDDLSCSVRLDIGSVVGEFIALALPYIACGGIEVTLRRANLEHVLDVPVVVRFLVIVNLRSTCSLHCSTRHTGLRASYEAMAISQAEKTGKGNDCGSALHVDDFDSKDLCRDQERMERTVSNSLQASIVTR